MKQIHRLLSLLLALALLCSLLPTAAFAVEVEPEEAATEVQEESTEAPSEEPTEPETEAPTEEPTEPETEPPTEEPTEPETEAPTEEPTEPETEPPTEEPTEPETEAPTEEPTEPETEPPTEEPTEPETEAPEEQTEAPEPETEAPQRQTEIPAIEPAEPTQSASEEIFLEDNSEEEAISDSAMNDAVTDGYCGYNLIWTLDNTGVLTITGYGNMDNYPPPCSSNPAPWHQISYIKSVEIKDGVTSIGEHAFCSNSFSGSSSLTRAIIPESVTYIGDWAFHDCNNLTIYGYTGSEAERYANSERIPFVPLDDQLEISDAGLYVKKGQLNTQVSTLHYAAGNFYYNSSAVNIQNPATSNFDVLFLSLTVENRRPNSSDSTISLELELPDGLSFESNRIVSKKTVSVNVSSSNTQRIWEKVYLLYSDSYGRSTATTTAKIKYNTTFRGKSRNDSLKLTDLHIDTPNNTITLTDSDETGNRFQISYKTSLFDLPTDKYEVDMSLYAAYLANIIESGEKGFLMSRIRDDLLAMGFSHIQYSGYTDARIAAGNMEEYVFAVKKVIDNNGSLKTIVLCAIQGTDALLSSSPNKRADMFGNFKLDIKRDVLNKYHQNFVTCINNDYNAFTSYLSAQGINPSSGSVKAVVTGHSRGGAVANGIAVHLTDDSMSGRIYAYTFAAPNYVSALAANNSRYNFIFNIINVKDCTPLVPTNYYKQGITLAFSRGSLLPRPQKNHSMVNYIAAVKANVFSNGWAAFLHDWREISIYCDVVKEIVIGPDRLVADAIKTMRKKPKSTVNSYHCPVNIEVLDSEGESVCAIVDDNIFYDFDSRVFLMVEGEEKRVIYPTGEGYTVRAIGNDVGTMDYTCIMVDEEGNDSGVFIFNDLPVREDEVVVSTTDNGSAYFFVDGSGNNKTPDEIITTPLDGDHGTWSWSYDTQTDTLTISGTGKMDDYLTFNGNFWVNSTPWKDKYNQITSVRIENGVTSIGAYAFAFMSNLTSVSIPGSVTSIGNDAFRNTSLSTVNIPAGCTSIGEAAFYDCPYISNINIPDSVTSIGNSAFGNCTSLTNVVIPNGITSIDDWTFGGCTSLTSITIPGTVKSINTCAFKGCTGLTSITIPNSVTSIANRAFNECTGLTRITIPDSVTSIGKYAFDGCTGLTSVTLPNRLTIIEYQTFHECTGLTTVTIPESITDIEGMAFYGCDKLTLKVVPGSYGEKYAKMLNIPYKFSTGSQSLSAAVISVANQTYTGKALTPAPKVVLNGTTLTKGQEYQVSYQNNTNAGRATVTVKGIGNYSGTATSTFQIQKSAIAPKVTMTGWTYGKSTKNPTVTGNTGNGKVTYTYAKKGSTTFSATKPTVPGTYIVKATIAESVNYKAATATVTFTIAKAAQTVKATKSSATIELGKSVTITGKGKGKITYQSANTKIATVTSKGVIKAIKPGTAKITIKAAGNGNYKAGTKVVTIKVVCPKPTISKVTNSKSKTMTVSWGKKAGVTGYQIQYSLKKNFSGAKTVTVKGAGTTSKAIGSLAKGKTYYIRIRTYYGNTKTVSAWSTTKTAKISK